MSELLGAAAFAIERDNLCLAWPRRNELHCVFGDCKLRPLPAS